MYVNYENTAVHQLWSESQGIIYMVNKSMKYLLRLFGIEEEYGLTLFCRYFVEMMNSRRKWDVSSQQINNHQMEQTKFKIVTVSVTSPVSNMLIKMFVMKNMKGGFPLKGFR